MLYRALTVIALMITMMLANVAIAQTTTTPDIDRVARVYLDAVKTSNPPAAKDVVTPRMMSWTEKFMRVVYDYKIIRDEPVCAETSDFAAIKQAVARYQTGAGFLADSLMAMDKGEERKKVLSELKEARETVQPSSPCLARLLPVGGHGLFTEEMLAANGQLSTALHHVLVDVETPGRGGAKKTERRQLSIGRVAVGGLSSGWRTINFGVLQ